jgi:hypothetical protein
VSGSSPCCGPSYHLLLEYFLLAAALCLLLECFVVAPYLLLLVWLCAAAPCLLLECFVAALSLSAVWCGLLSTVVVWLCGAAPLYYCCCVAVVVRPLLKTVVLGTALPFEDCCVMQLPLWTL